MKVKDLLLEHKLAVQLVDRSKIGANAVLISLPGGGHLVFLDRALPANLKLFALAHEAAHIDLGLLRPKAGYGAETEKRVDLRALELLSDALLPQRREELALKCRDAGGGFYDCLAAEEVFTAEALGWAADFCK